jgi:hypothetical protein
MKVEARRNRVCGQCATMERCWLAVAATALVTGKCAAQVVVPAAATSPAPIAGIAPSYGPKTVSAVPNAAAIVRRIWLPELDAGYDPQGLAVDDAAIYVGDLASANCRHCTELRPENGQHRLSQRQLGRPPRAVPGDPHRSRDGRLDRVCRRAEPVRPCRGYGSRAAI